MCLISQFVNGGLINRLVFKQSLQRRLYLFLFFNISFSKKREKRFLKVELFTRLQQPDEGQSNRDRAEANPDVAMHPVEIEPVPEVIFGCF